MILAEVDVVALMQSSASPATGRAKALSKAVRATSSCACEMIMESSYGLHQPQT